MQILTDLCWGGKKASTDLCAELIELNCSVQYPWVFLAHLLGFTFVFVVC